MRIIDGFFALMVFAALFLVVVVTTAEQARAPDTAVVTDNLREVTIEATDTACMTLKTPWMSNYAVLHDGRQASTQAHQFLMIQTISPVYRTTKCQEVTAILKCPCDQGQQMQINLNTETNRRLTEDGSRIGSILRRHIAAG